MRSTYTVMGYDVPDTSGGFPNESSAAGFTSVRPKLGIQKLVDPEVALEEFNTVRVLNQPLKTGSGGGGGGSGTGTGTGTGTGGGGSAANGGTVVGGKKLSVGVEVLIGLVGFFGLCFVLFGARWAYVKRHYRLQGATAGRGGGGGGKGMGDGGDGEGGGLEEAVAYRLARRRTKSDPYGPSEETLRASRFEDFKKKKAAEEDEEDEEEERMGEGKKRRDMEMGYVAVKMHARSDSEESTADPLSNANKTLSTTATKMRAQQEWERESLFSTLGKQPQDRGQDRQSGGSIFEDIPYPPPNLPLPSSHLNVNTNIASTAHPINTATTTTTKLGGDDMDISDHSLSISPTTPTTTTRASRTMPNISSFDLEGGRYPSISSTVQGRGSWYPDERDSRYADARDSRYSSNRDSRYSSNRASGYMASYSGRDQHQRTDSGEAGPSMPLLAHTRSESSISRLADPINVNDNFNEDDVERVSERHDAVNRNPYQQQTYPPFQQGSSVRRPISEFGEVEDGFRRVERRGEGRGGGEERPVSGVAGIGTRRGSGMGLFTPPTTHSHPHPHTHSHTPSRSHQRQQFGSRDMNMSGNRMSGMSGLSGMTVVDEIPPLPSMMPMETTSVDSSMTGEAAGSRILPPLSSQPPIETQTAQGPLGLRHSHPSRTDQPLVGEQMHSQGRGLPPPHQQQQQSYAGASRGVNASSLLRGETPEYKETSYGAPDYLGSAPDNSRTTTTTGRLRVGGGVYGGSEMMSGAPGFQASDLSLSAKGSTGHGS